MCGRYVLKILPYALQEFFDLLRMPEWNPRYNIAPTQTVIAVRQHNDGRTGDLLRWGVISDSESNPGDGAKRINIRSESVEKQFPFRRSERAGRCVIPADGFYEWQQLGRDDKQPWYISRTDGKPIGFAGVWRAWHSPESDEAYECCAILTTEANTKLCSMHHRMPVILTESAMSDWLDPSIQDESNLKKLLVACPDDWLSAIPVSKLVNSPRNDSPQCMEPAKLQRRLFD